MATMTRITPCLWFDTQAEEAATFYTGIFENSNIGDVSRYGPDFPDLDGTVMVVSFELDGQPFSALNGGPQFAFTEAVSFQIACETQDEVDHFWSKLVDGGQESTCGWLKDRFGVSWQVVPTVMPELLGDPDPERARRAMQAMLGMKKLDIAAMRRAADGD